MTKYKKGSIITGAISGIENYGVFVNLEGYYSGLIHISEVSHSFVKNLNELFEVGQPIKAKVIEVNDDLFQVKLSIKDLDYKVNKKSKDKIEEKGSGFRILASNLEKWIKTKLEEINKQISK